MGYSSFQAMLCAALLRSPLAVQPATLLVCSEAGCSGGVREKLDVCCRGKVWLLEKLLPIPNPQIKLPPAQVSEDVFGEMDLVCSGCGLEVVPKTPDESAAWRNDLGSCVKVTDEGLQV